MRYRFGVLFVHGIGQQRRGSTLSSWANPMVRWLEGWTDPEPAMLDSVTLVPGPGDLDPARARLRFRLDGADHTWLLAESWWAGRVTAPAFADLSRWLTGVAPWMVFAQYFPPLRRQVSALGQQLRTPGARRPGALLRRFGSVLLRLLVLGVAAPLGLAFLVLTTLVAMVLTLPLPWGRAPLEMLARALSDSIGDSFQLVRFAGLG